MRALRRIFALGALSALVMVGAPPGGAQTPTVTEVIGAADGLSADLTLQLGVGDPVDLTFGPEPSVTLPPEGGSVSDALADVDESAVVVDFVQVFLTAQALAVSAEGALGPDGFAAADTTLTNLDLVVDSDDLPEILDVVEAELVSAECSADLDGVSGSSTLAGLTVLGVAIIFEEGQPDPNTPLGPIEIDDGPLDATVSGVLNQQVENDDGSLSVSPLVLEISIAIEVFEEEFLTVTGTLEVGPATCGVVEGVIPADVVEVPAEPVPVQPTFAG